MHISFICVCRFYTFLVNVSDYGYGSLHHAVLLPAQPEVPALILHMSPRRWNLVLPVHICWSIANCWNTFSNYCGFVIYADGTCWMLEHIFATSICPSVLIMFRYHWICWYIFCDSTIPALKDIMYWWMTKCWICLNMFFKYPNFFMCKWICWSMFCTKLSLWLYYMQLF